MKLYQIRTPIRHRGAFVAGFEHDDVNDRVKRTAPIIKFMKGWSINRVQTYCHDKRWTMSEVAQ